MFGEGSYSGKGIYDVAAFEDDAGESSRRQSPAQSRSVRGHLRPLRSRLGCRGGRGVSVALRRGHGAPASLDARRLAIAALGAGRIPVAAAARPLEDVRQFAKVQPGARGSRGIRAVLAGIRAACVEPVLSRVPSCCRRCCRSSSLSCRASRISPGKVICAPCRGRLGAAALIGLRLVFWADQAWTHDDAIVRTLYRLCDLTAQSPAMDHDGTIERSSVGHVLGGSTAACPAASCWCRV